MTCVERIGGLARAKLPGAKLAVSTWFMDPQEIAAVMERLSRQPGLADRLIVEGPVPAAVAALGLPVVGFPEIGMHETFPRGGFGATPLPARAQLQWDRVKSQVAGGFPYSEGIYEDITKAVYSQFYWSDRPAAETGAGTYRGLFTPNMIKESRWYHVRVQWDCVNKPTIHVDGVEKSFTDAAANTDTSYIGPYFNVGVRLGIGVASTVGYALLDELRLCVTPPPPGTVVVVR